jgi:hypothetical protein
MPRLFLTLALSAGIFVVGALVPDDIPRMPVPTKSGPVAAYSSSA